jgi:hypothetical protein
MSDKKEETMLVIENENITVKTGKVVKIYNNFKNILTEAYEDLKEDPKRAIISGATSTARFVLDLPGNIVLLGFNIVFGVPEKIKEETLSKVEATTPSTFRQKVSAVLAAIADGVAFLYKKGLISVPGKLFVNASHLWANLVKVLEAGADWLRNKLTTFINSNVTKISIALWLTMALVLAAIVAAILIATVPAFAPAYMFIGGLTIGGFSIAGIAAGSAALQMGLTILASAVVFGVPALGLTLTAALSIDPVKFVATKSAESFLIAQTKFGSDDDEKFEIKKIPVQKSEIAPTFFDKLFNDVWEKDNNQLIIDKIPDDEASVHSHNGK